MQMLQPRQNLGLPLWCSRSEIEEKRGRERELRKGSIKYELDTAETWQT